MQMIQVKNLNIQFQTRQGLFHAVRDFSFSLNKGETLGIVGESGSGKSVSSMALLGLLADNAYVQADTCVLEGLDLLALKEKQWQTVRGRRIAMIFQDPMTSLNPVYTVGFQLEEALRAHLGGTKKENRKRALELMDMVAIPDAKTRLEAYPFELSGGMSQRVMIAMAMACDPDILIADEPTTALDVTIQAQILDLLREIQKEKGVAMLLITHDIGVVARYSDRLLVMYAGEVVESGKTRETINTPLHPYTRMLLESLPSTKHAFRSVLPTIPGMVPDLHQVPPGCLLEPRCRFRQEKCTKQKPQLQQEEEQRMVRCFYPLL